MFLHILWGNTHFLTDFKGWNEVTTQQHPLWAWAYPPNNLQGGRVISFSLQNRMEGEGEEKDWERRYSCDSCDSCDSFQGRGYMNSGCFQIVIIIFNLLYIFLYI